MGCNSPSFYRIHSSWSRPPSLSLRRPRQQKMSDTSFLRHLARSDIVRWRHRFLVLYRPPTWPRLKPYPDPIWIPRKNWRIKLQHHQIPTLLLRWTQHTQRNLSLSSTLSKKPTQCLTPFSEYGLYFLNTPSKRNEISHLPSPDNPNP